MRAQCCICADLFENSLTVNIAASPCGHTFHEECLLRWMDKSSTCPSCRTHIKKNQVIKRLFFDIREDADGDEDIDRLVNQIGNLKVQLLEKDKQKQELAESRDSLASQLRALEIIKKDLTYKLSEEKNIKDVMQRDLKLLRQENAAFIEEMKEFRKTQRKLQELQHIETILNGCDNDAQDIVSLYTEGSESSLKQLANVLAVLKREYNQVLKDKKALREQVLKLRKSMGLYHSESQRYKKKVKELKLDLERTNEVLSQVEKYNNENRRKIAHLRNALWYNKTEGSQSFHKALIEDSPNVACTPPNLLNLTAHDVMENEECADTINYDVKVCTSPDLFDASPVIPRNDHKRKYLGELCGPKLKFAKIPSASERLQIARQVKSDSDTGEVPKVPQAMFSIMQKKVTGQSNSRAHVPSVITRGYDGFGGSTTFVHSQDQAKHAPIKSISKKNISVRRKLIHPKFFVKQPQINNFVQSFCSQTPLLHQGKTEQCNKLDASCKMHADSIKPKADLVPVIPNTFRTLTSLQNVPKLSSDSADFVDLL